MGPKIGDWNKFSQKALSDIAKSDGNLNIIEGKISAVKEAQKPASGLKIFLRTILSIPTLCIYELYKLISDSKTENARAGLKAGVQDLHAAMAYLSAKQAQAITLTTGNLFKAGTIYKTALKDDFVGKKAAAELPPGCKLKYGDDKDKHFKGMPYIQLKMGKAKIEIGLRALESEFSAGVPQGSALIRIVNGEGKGKDMIIEVPNLEKALENLEDNIVKNTDFFEPDFPDRMIASYDRMLEATEAVKGGQSAGGLARPALKDRQLALCRNIIRSYGGLSEAEIAMLDRVTARELASNIAKNNITSPEALKIHYEKIVAQHHISTADMERLYAQLEKDEMAGNVKLAFAEPPAQDAPKPDEKGRPNAQQKAVHDFAADLFLDVDYAVYDKDIGSSGLLDGQRLRNAFAAHKATISALVLERQGADKENMPSLATLNANVREAVTRILDEVIKGINKKLEPSTWSSGEVHEGEFAKFAAEERPAKQIESLIETFDHIVSDEILRKVEIDDLNHEKLHDGLGLGTGVGPADYRMKAAAHPEGDVLDQEELINDADKERKAMEARLVGKANFFSQLEVEIGQALEKAMKETVQSKIKEMVKDVFPAPNPNGKVGIKDGLDKVLNDHASDSEILLLQKTLDIYFERMPLVDKRSMMAMMVRTTTEEASNEKKLGALLKGAGPVLQKMLQGLDPSTFKSADFREAIADMRSNLAPIPEKTVKAYLNDAVVKSNGAIKSITVTKSMGAASVGQTFRCSIEYSGESEPRECVVKLLRPDAKLRAYREEQVFLDAAKSINEGAVGSFKNRFATIMSEMDFTIEAKNVEEGLKAYDAGEGVHNKTYKNVNSMRLVQGVAPTANMMMLEKAPGVTMSEYVETTEAEIKGIVSEKIGNLPKDGVNTLVSLVEATDTLGEIYTDAKEKQAALTNLSTLWIREGLLTKTGFYHGDLHAGNLMVPKRGEVKRADNGASDNQVTMIDFGNATKLGKEEQKSVIQIIAGAAGRDLKLFTEGLVKLLPAEAKAKFEAGRPQITDLIEKAMKQGKGAEAGKRMAVIFKLLQRDFAIETPSAINNFQTSQTRLTVAIEQMLRTMTMAEVARLDLVLAASGKSKDEIKSMGFEMKKNEAIKFLDAQIEAEGIDEDTKGKLGELRGRIVLDDKDRPLTMMQCMVGAIKTNLVSAISAIGMGKAKGLVTTLKREGVIPDESNPQQQQPQPGADPLGPGVKERRDETIIWP